MLWYACDTSYHNIECSLVSDYDPSDGLSVRLVGGPSSNTGRVEMYSGVVYVMMIGALKMLKLCVVN